MKKIFSIICGLMILTFSTLNAQGFNKFKKALEETIGTSTPKGLGEDEIASGLKEALVIGVKKGVEQLAKPDGFFKDLSIKIPLPEEAKVAEDMLRKIGFNQQVDDAIESINRAAEDAVIGATDIFVDAIKTMSITDAMGLLKGGDDAATQFLDKSTRSALSEKFQPVIKVSLDKVGATKYWETIFSKYNKIPFVTKVNPDLEKYATEKAIDGLFKQIAKQELEIRKNPGARVTDLLKKVFAQ